MPCYGLAMATTSVELTISDDLTAVFVFEDDQPQPVEITVRGPKLDNATMRQPWGTRITEARQKARQGSTADPALTELVTAVEKIPLPLLTAETKQALAAALFVEAVAGGSGSPARAVAERLGSPVNSILTWVKLAKRAGFLDSQPGQVGGTFTAKGKAVLRKAAK